MRVAPTPAEFLAAHPELDPAYVRAWRRERMVHALVTGTGDLVPSEGHRRTAVSVVRYADALIAELDLPPQESSR